MVGKTIAYLKGTAYFAVTPAKYAVPLCKIHEEYPLQIYDTNKIIPSYPQSYPKSVTHCKVCSTTYQICSTPVKYIVPPAKYAVPNKVIPKVIPRVIPKSVTTCKMCSTTCKVCNTPCKYTVPLLIAVPHAKYAVQSAK